MAIEENEDQWQDDDRSSNRIRILAININGFPSKKANKHKLKAINEWMEDKDIGIFIESGINEDNQLVAIHDEFKYDRHNC